MILLKPRLCDNLFATISSEIWKILDYLVLVVVKTGTKGIEKSSYRKQKLNGWDGLCYFGVGLVWI